ncbi:type IV pilus inner membrane component PilO [Acinetobacter shaoyimingii]|uniref:Type 4a pilus biogenesis protein PilO n=1 Tax=Acinetobacter shaoyimingii TaxID=2715164 RepID=A0A6G8RRZ1_9GAMM|nr:type 4a pilus biogenesis protein PilO [Acinetobacter shaoyimingii]QIO04739.1 type 4a pilus biogenesis protein PilO [Acinetobacter shaoyimingii]
MSQDDLDNLDLDKQAAKNKQMTVERFVQQFNTLDPNNMGSWPLSVKITFWIIIFVVVCLLGYFLAIKPKLDSIDQAKAQQQSLLEDFKKKDSDLRNLKLYQAQLNQMEENFNQQLQQLPKETEIPSLVEDINLTGVNSGLKFKNIKLESEVAQEFFIEQPISIEATGDYHSFGNFVSGIAALARIVTLHDFNISAELQKDKKSDIPKIDYLIQAKTYRYVAGNAQPKDSKQPPAKKKSGGEK